MVLNRFSVAFMAFSAATRASADDAVTAEKPDSTRWRPFVSTFFSVPMMQVEITGPEREDDDENPLNGGGGQRIVSYEPETSPDVGVGLDYGPFALAVSLPLTPSSSTEDEGEAPPSRYWDTKLSYSAWLFHLEGGEHRYQGFTYSASGDDDGLTDEDEENDPNLIKRGRYANVFFYPLGKDFDLGRRANEARHRGLRWSPVVQSYYERTDLSSSAPIIPAEYETDFGRDAGMRELRVEAYGLAGGGAVKFGLEGWQTDFAMTFGRSVDFQEMAMATGAAQARRRMGRKMSMRLGGDVFVDGWDLGLAMMMDQASTPLSEGTLDTQLGVIQVSAGLILL